MGQNSSKPHANRQIQQLKQLYEPASRLTYLPGQPLCIQYCAPSHQNQVGHPTQHQSFLELYTFELNSSEKQVFQDTRIYQLRRNQLPWVVKVVSFDVERKHCECSFFACKYTVCTERVDFRLHSFKTSGKGFADLSTSKKYVQSFSLQEGVYVLINALQGYQILTQQFRVSCPSAKSIGITRQGEIKVWINQNWSLNQQNLISMQDREVIEQVVRLVVQRTKGNLSKMLGLQAGYSSFTFTHIQSILSQFVIAFNRGKMSLKERVAEASLRLLDDSVAKSRKFSLKKEKQDQAAKAGILSTPQKSKHKNQATQRRFYSQELKKENIDYSFMHTQNHSAKKERISYVNSQLKKEVKFVYTRNQQPNAIRANSSEVIQNNTPGAYKMSPKITFRSEPVINNFYSMEQKNNSLPVFEKAMNRKISDNAKTLTNATTHNSSQPSRVKEKTLSNKLNMVINTNYQIKKNILELSQSQKSNILGTFEQEYNKRKKVNGSVLKQRPQKAEKDCNILKSVPKTVSLVTPQSILAKGQILITQQRSQPNTPSKLQSINSITQEFRQLLQSDTKIKRQFDLSGQQLLDMTFLPLEKNQKQLIYNQESLLYQKSESDIVRPSMTKCYSIKQVDEELSYELDAYNM